MGKRITKSGNTRKVKFMENGNKEMNNIEIGKSSLMIALVKAQLEITPPVKDGVSNAHGKPFRYATLDSIYSAIRKPLAENGLSLFHDMESAGENRYFLVTTLKHISGESMQSKFPMVIEKLTNQGIGAARTYACRYATCNLLALPSDEDDDANSADGKKDRVKVNEDKLTPDQCLAIEEYTSQDKELEKRILNGYKVRALSEIRISNFEPIMRNLMKKQQKSA